MHCSSNPVENKRDERSTLVVTGFAWFPGRQNGSIPAAFSPETTRRQLTIDDLANASGEVLSPLPLPHIFLLDVPSSFGAPRSMLPCGVLPTFHAVLERISSGIVGSVELGDSKLPFGWRRALCVWVGKWDLHTLCVCHLLGVPGISRNHSQTLYAPRSCGSCVCKPLSFANTLNNKLAGQVKKLLTRQTRKRHIDVDTRKDRVYMLGMPGWLPVRCRQRI